MTHAENIEVLNQHNDDAHFASIPSEEVAVNTVDVEFVEAAHYDRQALVQDVPADASATGAHSEIPTKEFV